MAVVVLVDARTEGKRHGMLVFVPIWISVFQYLSILEDLIVLNLVNRQTDMSKKTFKVNIKASILSAYKSTNNHD